MVGQIDNWLPLDLQDETARNGAVASADFLDVKKVREKNGLLWYILYTSPNLW